MRAACVRELAPSFSTSRRRNPDSESRFRHGDLDVRGSDEEHAVARRALPGPGAGDVRCLLRKRPPLRGRAWRAGPRPVGSADRLADHEALSAGRDRRFRASPSCAISRVRKWFNAVRRTAMAPSFPIMSQLGATDVARMSAPNWNSNASAMYRASVNLTEFLSGI
jgi:hypothetical protein